MPLGGGIAAGRCLFAAWLASRFRGHLRVEGTHQPVERRVVDQIIHDIVERIFHHAQVDFAAGQHTVWQVCQPVGLVKVGVHLRGRVAERQRLLLDVVGEALQAGDQAQAGGLELLGEGMDQRKRAGLDYLCRGDEGMSKNSL